MIQKKDERFLISCQNIGLELQNNSLLFVNFGDQTINLPLFFFVNHNKPPQFCELEIFSMLDSQICCYGINNAKESFKCNISTQDNQINFSVYDANQPIGFMWPSIGKTYYGEEMLPIDCNIVQTAIYLEKNNDTHVLDILVPCVNHVNSRNKCMSVFGNGESKYSSFYYNSAHYCNVTFSPPFKISFSCFNTKREALTWWHQNNPRTIQSINITEFINKQTMQKVLFGGWKINDIDGPSEYLLNITRRMQELLHRNSIRTCIVGSMAMHLHGIRTNVLDIDILTNRKSSLQKIVNILQKEECDLSIVQDPKGEMSSLRIILPDGQIDITYVNRFDWLNGIDDINGFRVIKKEHLLFMKLVKDFERNILTPDLSKNKNVSAILSLMHAFSPWLYPFLDEYLSHDYMPRFYHLYKELQDGQWYEHTVSVNQPFICNAFIKGKIILIPVINTGTESEANVSISDEINKAIWMPLESSDDTQCQIDHSGGKTNVHIARVESLGLLTCYM